MKAQNRTKFDNDLQVIEKAHDGSKRTTGLETANMERQAKAARRLIRKNFGWPYDLRLQLIMHYGFDKNMIDGVMAFNEKLKKSKGELILVVVESTNLRGGCQTEILRPDLNRTGVSLNFYLGRIDRELSFKDGSENDLTLGHAGFFPSKHMAWADIITDEGIGSPEECISFPSARFMGALRKGKSILDFMRDENTDVKILVGDKEIADFEKRMELAYYSTLHALKELLAGKE